MIAVHRVETLPHDIAVLTDAANREGMALVARLVADYQSGSNRFDREGEGLWQLGATATGVAKRSFQLNL